MSFPIKLLFRLMRAKHPPFATRHDVDRYLGGETIECLLCGQHFRRLGGHLRAAHGVSANEYRSSFGLPWARGLISAASVAASGWTEKRKTEARRLALGSRFFELAHTTPRRELAPFLKSEAVKHLGIDPSILSTSFERRVRILFEKGLSDRAIARELRVGASTVNRRTRHLRDKRAGRGFTAAKL